MERLENKVKYLWIIKSIIGGLILGSALGAGIYTLIESVYFATIPIVLLPFLMAWYSVHRYRNWGFEPRSDHMYIKYGVLRKVYIMVPHVRIQHIDTRRGPLERVLGLSSLKIYTAGSRGADVRIPGLTKLRAGELQQELRDDAIESEKGFDGV